jgi:hypothetical protein
MNPNDNIQRTIASLSNKGSFSHAYIIWGPSDQGKAALAEKLAGMMLCSGNGAKPCMLCPQCLKTSRMIHPDVIAIDKLEDKRELLVDQIRALREDAVILPNEADKKVYIIKNADTMNASAQNAILKLLEEPPSYAAFLLLAKNPGELLPTVRSRCVEIGLSDQEADLPGIADETVRSFFQALESGPLQLSEFSFILEKLDKNEMGGFIASAKLAAALRLRALQDRNGPLSASYLMSVIKTLGLAGEYLAFNVSTGHISGMLCAELLKRNEEIR